MWGGKSTWSFLTSVLDVDGGEWSNSSPAYFASGERAATNRWIGIWVGPRVSLDTVVKGNSLLLLLGIYKRFITCIIFNLVTIPTKLLEKECKIMELFYAGILQFT